MSAPSLNELRPYLYIISGILLLVTQQDLFAWGWGGCLYLYGVRGCLARVAPHRLTPRARKRLHLPTRLYEAAPFVYLFAGLICVQLAGHFTSAHVVPLTLAASLLFVVAGLGSWLLRLHYRLAPRYRRQAS